MTKGNKLIDLFAQGGGTYAGFKIGSAFGPIGSAVGAGAGYLAGLLFSSDDDAPANSNPTKEELEQKIKSVNDKSTKKLEKLITSLNSNKGSQDLQAQQQYQASQQQFMMMMLLFTQNQKPALEAGQSLAKEELREIKQALKEAETKNKELLAQIKSFQDEQAKKEEEKKTIQQQITQLDQDLAEKKLTADEHQQRVAVLRQQEQVAQTRIDEILASVATLQEELKNSAIDKDGLVAKKEQVQESLASYQQQINQLANNLNTVATQHGINRQVPIINIDSNKPLQSSIQVLDDISSVSDLDYQQENPTKKAEDGFKEWLNEAKPYLKWGGIGLAVIFVVSVIFKFFNTIMRMF